MGIKDFFIEDVDDDEQAEEDNQFGYDEWQQQQNPDAQQQQPQPAETGDEGDEKNLPAGADVPEDLPRPDGEPESPVSEEDEFAWVDQRHALDEQYWPYAFTPDGESVTIGADEVLMAGATDAEGRDQGYAGQWVREMVEAHEVRPDDNTWVGYTRDNVQGVQECGIEYTSLFRHMAFFGVTGYGKSTVLKNLMVQWAFMGFGFCFIDPKGGDIVELVETLPEHRLDDIVWVEPGSEVYDSVVGFNFFDTYHEPGTTKHENEVQEIVNDFVAILKSGKSGWGATMDSVAKAVAQQLVRADKDYTVLDMYKILSDEDERQAFADEFGGDIESIYLDRMAKYEDDEFDPLLRRFQEWTDNKITREIVAHEKSSINITEIVEEGKILLVRTSNIPSEDVKALVATAIVRRIWSTIRTRANIPKEEREAFFVVMDEFDQLTRGEMNIEDMLSKGRSLRLSVCLANQQPKQLPEEVREAIYGNADNMFTFNPGQSIQDAQDLSKAFDVEVTEIMSLSQFQLLGRFQVGSKKTDPILVQTFAPYPPRRRTEAAQKIIQHSVDRYGVSGLAEEGDFDQYGLLGREGEDEDVDRIELPGGDEITVPQILESVHTAGVRYGTHEKNDKQGWVEVEDIRKELHKYTDAVDDGAVLDNALEKIPTTLLQDLGEGETTFYRLTTEGEEEAFVQDTGRSASGGKAGHRRLLKRGYDAFTRLGYDVKLPTQEGGEQPDGVAIPPIKPIQESSSMEEAKKLEDKLKRKYPRLQELFGDSDISLEAESTTISKPKQTIKNLAKAMRNGQKCVFLVKDGTSTHDRFEYYARAGYRVLSDPPMVNSTDDEGNLRYYNYTTDSPLRLKDETFALRKSADANTVWRDDGDRIILENPEDPNGEPLAIFKDTADLEKPSSAKFPFNYEYDQSNQEYIVKDKKGNVIETYENKGDMLDDFDIIPKPVIPENVFPGGEYPDEEDWMFVIIPDDTSDKGPHIYNGEDENGNPDLDPLFINDDPYNAIKGESLPEAQFDTDDDDEDDDGDTTDPSDTPDPVADDDEEEVPIADPNGPKSTNDVVKESSEVWTKPEEGDDDYDPTKDGKKFANSYDEYHSEAGDGGLAREEDDGSMKDYQTPEEKEEERLRQEWAQEQADRRKAEDSDAEEGDEAADEEDDSDSETVDAFKKGAFSRKRLRKQREARESSDEDDSDDDEEN